jgi:hypothetical protein
LAKLCINCGKNTVVIAVTRQERTAGVASLREYIEAAVQKLPHLGR